MPVTKRDLEVIDRWHRNQGVTKMPDKKMDKSREGNLNRLKHGIFADRMLEEDERGMFDAVIEKLHLDFQFNKSSDFIQVELIGVYMVKLARAEAGGNESAADSLDRRIRAHMRDLKTTKMAREGEEAKGSQTTPADWASELLKKGAEKIVEEQQALTKSSKKPKKSADKTKK